jgi:hypothetical protein
VNGNAKKETPEASPGSRFTVSTGRATGAQRLLIYGCGGVGKSTLASLAPKPVFLDVEGSTNRLDVARVSGITAWADLRACLQSNALDDFKTIVIDSVTKAEEMAVEHTIQTVKHEKGHKVDSLTAYGFGKGVEHVFDTFLPLLMDCDRHVRAGRNVVLIAHACTTDVPNPFGDDFIQYQPRLQQTKKGNASIRSRTFEWCDHVLFIGYDIASKDGKGLGGGTRTIFTKEQPTHQAKVRELDEAIDNRPYENATDGSIWPLILGGAS